MAQTMDNRGQKPGVDLSLYAHLSRRCSLHAYVLSVGPQAPYRRSYASLTEVPARFAEPLEHNQLSILEMDQHGCLILFCFPGEIPANNCIGLKLLKENTWISV